MNKLLFIILLFSSISNAQSNSIELIGGGLTYHLFSDPTISSKFSNQLSSDGSLIYTPMIGFKRMDYNEYGFYDGEAFFFGKNSINENMGGFIYDFGINLGKWDFGFATGFYYNDEYLFVQKGIGEDSINGIVPIFGLEFNYKTYIYKNNFIKINNLFTLELFNTTFSIGQDF